MNIHIIILILALPAVICVAMILQTWDRVDSIMVKYNIKYTGEKNNFFDFIRIIKVYLKEIYILKEEKRLLGQTIFQSLIVYFTIITIITIIIINHI